MIDLVKAQQVLRFLESHHLTLGAAESLTGGLFAATICSVPGASKVFKGAVVSYAPSVKEDLLGVKAEDIARYGVVSETVARAMAEGALKALHVNLAVSFSGNAGPTSEPGQAPVGRVNMAIAFVRNNTPMAVYVEEKNFVGERNSIREASVNAMMEAILSLQKAIEGHD